MIFPKPEFPPLFSSGEWWRLRVKALLEGADREGSIVVANRDSKIKSREWMRFRVADRTGSETTLSIPIVHGASALKNQSSQRWLIAPDKPPLRKIDATLATLYGHTPFYELLGSMLSVQPVAGRKALEVCMEMDAMIWNILGFDNPSIFSSLKNIDEENKGLNALAKEMKDFNSQLSMLDGIFRYGQQIILQLIPTFYISE